MKRARPNKVVKANSASQQQRARLARNSDLAASLVAAHEAANLVADQDLGRVGDLDPTQAYDPADDHSYAAAAAVAAAAAQHHQGHHVDLGIEDGEGEAEADADMDDDDGMTHAMVGQHTDQMDLTQAANILANGNAGVADPAVMQHPQLPHAHQHQGHQQQHPHQQQHHPHQHQHQPAAPMGTPQMSAAHAHSLDPQLVKSTEELAMDSGYSNLNVESALAKRLAREPGIRLAQQRRPEQQLNLARRSNVEALFAHIAGTLAPQPCKNCHKGHGPWNTCVVVDGQMCGSCANCWFNASGARCSFHETRNPSAVASHAASAPIASHNAGPISVTDAAGHYSIPGAMLASAPAPSGSVLAALGMPAPVNPMVQFTISNAMQQVRNADRKARQLMQIEIAAKQLALHMAEYEDDEEESQGGAPPGPSVMGDDTN